MMSNRIAVIIPVYNESKVIHEVIEGVLKTYKNVICVDDGSVDNSVEEILNTDATLVKHPINLGQGAALQTGIEYALLDPEVEYFVTYDADGQHSLSDVKEMIKIIKKENYDIILGSRFLGKAENISWFKKNILKTAVLFSNKTSGIKLTDAHNGLRVFNRKVASTLKLTMPDFSHASEIIDRISQNKYTYKEVPVTIIYTDYSRSKGQSIMNAVNIGFDMLLKKLIKK